jgi:hypothetical protein
VAEIWFLPVFVAWAIKMAAIGAIPDAEASRQAEYFAENCARFGIELFDV